MLGHVLLLNHELVEQQAVGELAASASRQQRQVLEVHRVKVEVIDIPEIILCQRILLFENNKMDLDSNFEFKLPFLVENQKPRFFKSEKVIIISVSD